MFLYNLLIIVCFCLGLRTITHQGKIGYVLRQRLEQSKLSDLIKKPLLLCIECTASFWGTIIYCLNVYLYYGVSIEALIIWPLVVISASFFNGLFWKFYLWLEYIIKQYEAYYADIEDLKN